jgi:hypothetical protein
MVVRATRKKTKILFDVEICFRSNKKYKKKNDRTDGELVRGNAVPAHANASKSEGY